MDAEVTELVGPKGRHDPDRTMNRHGAEPATVTLGGRRVPVRRPRVRTIASEDGESAQEVPLESYTTLAATDLLTEGIVARMLAGISTRRYPVALEPVGAQVEQMASSTSKSAVSRRFVAATAERLAELHARPLGDQRWLVVYLDGFSFGDHTLVGALGVTLDGTKVPLGVVEGSTENAAVCTRLVSDLAARGLDATRGMLFVVDGGKAIAKAVDDVYGHQVLLVAMPAATHAEYAAALGITRSRVTQMSDLRQSLTSENSLSPKPDQSSGTPPWPTTCWSTESRSTRRRATASRASVAPAF